MARVVLIVVVAGAIVLGAGVFVLGAFPPKPHVQQIEKTLPNGQFKTTTG